MDFQYDDEQKLLADSVDRWLREKYSFETWRKLVAAEPGFAAGNWAEMAELGWLGVAVSEPMGGLGGGAVEQMIIMEGLGRGLVAEPYLWTAVVGRSLLELAGNAAQQAHLAALAEGKLQVAFAFAERQARKVHRAALTSDAARHTALTNLFTGRPARGIVNRVMRELGALSSVAPEFPLATSAITPLRTKAESLGSGDFSPLWSGQNTRGCREISAGELTLELTKGMR